MKRVNRGRPLRRSWLFWFGLLTLAAGTFLVAQDYFKTEEQTVYETDLAAFFKEIDDSYPLFDLKGIQRDWAAAKRKLSEKVKACQSDTEFFGIVIDAIRCLRDPHMRLLGSEAKPPAPPPEYYPGIGFLPAMNQGVVVMHPPPGARGGVEDGHGRHKNRWQGRQAIPGGTRAEGLGLGRLLLQPAAGEAVRVSYSSSRQRRRKAHHNLLFNGEDARDCADLQSPGTRMAAYLQSPCRPETGWTILLLHKAPQWGRLHVSSPRGQQRRAGDKPGPVKVPWGKRLDY